MSFLSVANDRFGHKARHSPFTNDLFGHKAIQRRRKGGPLASQNGQNLGGFGGQGPPDPPNWRSAPPVERSAPLEIFFSGPLRQSVSSSKIIHKMHSEKKINSLFQFFKWSLVYGTIFTRYVVFFSSFRLTFERKFLITFIKLERKKYLLHLERGSVFYILSEEGCRIWRIII